MPFNNKCKTACDWPASVNGSGCSLKQTFVREERLRDQPKERLPRGYTISGLKLATKVSECCVMPAYVSEVSLGMAANKCITCPEKEEIGFFARVVTL